MRRVLGGIESIVFPLDGVGVHRYERALLAGRRLAVRSQEHDLGAAALAVRDVVVFSHGRHPAKE